MNDETVNIKWFFILIDGRSIFYNDADVHIKLINLIIEHSGNVVLTSENDIEPLIVTAIRQILDLHFFKKVLRKIFFEVFNRSD
jgi:hypothetical protein